MGLHRYHVISMGFIDTLIHLFIPRQTNNHRAKLLQIDALSLYLLFFIFCNIILRVVHQAAPTVLGYASNIYVNQLLDDTNKKRVDAGLNPVVLNSQLSQAALSKAQNMFSENYWAHNSPSGKTPWDFINTSGYHYTLAGENLAKNFMDSQGVVDAWMASPSHRDNIMKSGYRDVGFAVVNGVLNGEETTLVVQMFGSTSSVVSAKPAVPIAEGRSVEAPQPVIPADNSDKINPQKDLVPPKTIPMVSGVSNKPLFNLTIINKVLMYGFAVIMIVVLAIDAFIVSRKRIVRVAGHNLGHILFFITLVVISIFSYTGSIL